MIIESGKSRICRLSQQEPAFHSESKGHQQEGLMLQIEVQG